MSNLGNFSAGNMLLSRGALVMLPAGLPAPLVSASFPALYHGVFRPDDRDAAYRLVHARQLPFNVLVVEGIVGGVAYEPVTQLFRNLEICQPAEKRSACCMEGDGKALVHIGAAGLFQ